MTFDYCCHGIERKDCDQCSRAIPEPVQQITKQNYIRLGIAAFKEHELREIVNGLVSILGDSTPGPAATPRPTAFLAWAVEMFGPVAKLRSERLLRFVEEAIELAHAEGMERIMLNMVAERVYSRPAGNVGKEIGQAQACLETFAENIGLSSADEAEREWQRVQEIPRDEWTRRHAAKAAVGIATVSRPQDRAPK